MLRPHRCARVAAAIAGFATTVLCVFAVVGLARVDVSLAAPGAAEVCQAGKQRSAGRYAACRMRADAKFTKRGRFAPHASRLAECAERLDISNLALETLHDPACPTTGDASETAAFLATCAGAVADATSGERSALCRGRIAVANRGTNTVTLIEVDSEQKLQIELEEGSEPMYVHSPRGSNELWIGDREFDRVVVYDMVHYRRIAELPTARGVFHMWSHPASGQLWVVGDKDKAMTVIDVGTKQVLATVPVPADLAANYKPHDVTVTRRGAVVSLLDTDDSNSGWLVGFDGTTFEETGRLAVGGDPHIMYWGFEGSRMYVASQTADRVLRVDPSDLSVTGTLPVEGAHGIWADEAETRLFVTNIETPTGAGGLHTIDITDGAFEEIAGSPVDTLFPVPHNVTTSLAADRLFVTHGSNSFEFVSAYDLDADGLPSSPTAIRTGRTAFGAVFVPDPLCSAAAPPR